MELVSEKTDKKRMLLIDDEVKLLLGLKAVMERAGYEVIDAHNGDEGLKLAETCDPDVIICDVMMPAPNGFQLKKILAANPQTAGIPFFFLTARTLDADKIAGLRQGADDYITKPFNVDELLARIESLLRRIDLERKKSQNEMDLALEKLRRTISTNIGHELRTPLAIILASLDMAIREKFEGKTDGLHWCLETSLNSAHHLSMLVNDLIILNDIDTGTVSAFRRPIDLRFNFSEPIQEVINRYEHKKLNLHISVTSDIELVAPRLEFSQVVSHLVDNACKFSPNKANIWIELIPKGAGGFILTVENEGSSIPVELREKVFERYYQIQQGDNRSYGGLGIGLTIVRAVAEAGGGSALVVDSRVGCKLRIIYPPAPADWP